MDWVVTGERGRRWTRGEKIRSLALERIAGKPKSWRNAARALVPQSRGKKKEKLLETVISS